MWPAIIQQLSEQLGKDFHLVEKEKVHGVTLMNALWLAME